MVDNLKYLGTDCIFLQQPVLIHVKSNCLIYHLSFEMLDLDQIY